MAKGRPPDLLAGTTPGWEDDPNQVSIVAHRAVRRLGALCPGTADDDFEMAVNVVRVAIWAIRGKGSAQESIRAMHPMAVGNRDAQMGEFVLTCAQKARAAKNDDGRQGAAKLLVNLLEEFDKAYGALREPPAFERLVARLRVSVLWRPKKGHHTIGASVLEIQRIAGKLGPLPKELEKRRRGSIDRVLRKRFGDD